MKDKLVRKSLVVGVIILFVGITVIPSLSGKNINNDEDLVVTVTTDRDVYYLGQPVRITISVTNNGPDTTLVFCDSQLADFNITNSDGKQIFWWSWHFFFLQIVLEMPIRHGETIVLLEWIWYKLRDFYPFFEILRLPVLPGKYYINGWMVACSHPMIEDEPVEISLQWFRFI